MPDLLLRDTNRDELIDELTQRVVAALRPIVEQHSQPLLVDAERLAEMLSVSRPTVDRLRAQGVIPSVMEGRLRRFDPEAVVAALSRQEADDAS